MKKTVYLIFAVVLLTLNGYTQGLNKDQHTLETKVADVLLRLSVRNPIDKDKIYKDLAELGEGVIPLITGDLVVSGEDGSDITRKAISGLIETIAKGDNKIQKEDYSKALGKAIEKEKNEEIRKFLVNELNHLKNGTFDHLIISSSGSGATPKNYFASLDSIELIFQTDSWKNQENSLTNLVAEINNSDHTPDQKVLLLRNAMGLAKTPAQKKAILIECSKENTLLSLIFISKFLDCPELRQTAADAAYTVILANSDLYGQKITQIATDILGSKDISVSKTKKSMLKKHLQSLPKAYGYKSMFNGKDLTGWKGLVGNPLTRVEMNTDSLREKQKKADEQMMNDWQVEDGIIYYSGNGYDNICSKKMFKDFELILDWRIEPHVWRLW